MVVGMTAHTVLPLLPWSEYPQSWASSLMMRSPRPRVSWVVVVRGRGLSGLGSCTAQMMELAVFISPSHPWRSGCAASAWRTALATSSPTTVVTSSAQEPRSHKVSVRWVKRRVLARLSEFALKRRAEKSGTPSPMASPQSNGAVRGCGGC